MSVAERALNRIGRDVTIRNYTQVGTDRPSWNLTSGSPYTVKARVDYDTSPQQIASAQTIDVDIDVDVYILESAAGGISEIRDGGGDGSSEIDVDGVTMIVRLKDVQDNGFIRLSCVREA